MSPLQLSNLPVRTVAVSGDLMLLRNGSTDYQIDVKFIRTLDLRSYGLVPSANATDLMLLQRGATSFKINFNQVGFLAATFMWFFQATAPSNWQIVPNTGDRLLAVSDSTIKYKGQNGGTPGGSWSQEGVGGGTGALTIDQIPSHTHTIATYHQVDANDSVTKVGPGKNSQTGTATTDATGGGKTHNHGNKWRPEANIGIICKKLT